MITTLHIKNIGIIEDLEVNFNKGLNVLTGETGAGKTLIIDSLSIICGERFSKERIRKGEDYSFVELSLYSPQREECDIIVSREIYANGRNTCKINGRLVTVTELKDFMNNMIDIHGQHDNQSLLDDNKHIKYLDNFTGKELEEKKTQYQELYKKYCEIILELKQNYGDEKEKQRKLDLLKYQVNEIESANLKQNEEEELQEKRGLILNAEKITQNMIEADMQLSQKTMESMCIAIKNLERIMDYNENYKKIANALKNNYYDLEEIAHEVKVLKEDTYFDEEERKDTETRLDLIYSLKRKYGNNISEILKYKENIQIEINTIENLEQYITILQNKKITIESQMKLLALEMREIRLKYAKELSNSINSELKELEMKNAIFSVNIQERDNFHVDGLDIIQFLITTNMGEEAKPLSKIVSGGEMARIMLAIKTILANVDDIPILVFDEIDTGISGIAANKVGEKLRQIAKKHQVLIVTHLASIAAKGEYNYYIHKKVNQNKTKTEIQLLKEEQVLKEIARLSSGNITNISLEYAKEIRE